MSEETTLIEGETVNNEQINSNIVETEETIEDNLHQEEPEEEKVPKGVQKRLDRMTWEKHEAQRARERADAELAQMRRELEQLKAKPQEPAKTLPNGAPDPDKYPAGRYDPDYLEAVTDYKVQQRFEQQQASLLAQEKQRHVVAMEEKAKAALPDYTEKTAVMLSHPLAQSQQFRDILLDADNPAELGYFLGNNPEELDKIGEMTPTQAIRYIGRLEAKISNTPVEAPKKAPTTAPKPPAPLGSAKGTGIKDPENMTMAEYTAWRESSKK